MKQAWSCWIVGLCCWTLQANAQDTPPTDVSDWLKLEPNLKIAYQGSSRFHYQPADVPDGFEVRHRFTATWWITDQEADGRLRVMRVLRGAEESRKDPPGVLQVKFFWIHPKTLFASDEVRGETRFGTSGPSVPLAPFPELTAEQIETEETWEEPRLLGGNGVPHRLSVAYTDSQDGHDIVTVGLELAGELPIASQVSGMAVRYDVWTRRYDVDINDGRVLSFTNKFYLHLNSVLQNEDLELKLLAWDKLDASHVEAARQQIQALRKIDVLLGTDPRQAGKNATAFLAEFPDSELREVAIWFQGEATTYAESMESDKVQAAKFAEMQGKPAPDFTLLDLEGHEVSLADFHGKVVLLTFWGVG